MDDYVAVLREEEIVGIPISAWQRCLGMLSQDWKEENVVAALRTLERYAAQRDESLTVEQLVAARERLIELADLVRGA